MAVFKATMLLTLATNVSSGSSGKRIGGWSESWYDVDDSLVNTQRFFLRLCQKRAAMLPVGAAVIGQRYQAIDPVGGSVTSHRVYPGLQAANDVPQMSVQYSLPARATPNIRLVTLRGLPDDNAIEGEFKPTPEYQRALTAFNAEVDGWYFRGRNLQLDEIPVVSVAVDGTFVLGADLTFSAGTLLRFFKLKETSFDTTVSGLWRVNVRTDARHGTLYNWSSGQREGGGVRVEGIVYPQINGNVTVTPKVTVRKVGRPSDLYRGRASNRA